MNALLNFAGALLYLAFSLVLLPVFVLFDVVMGLWLSLRFMARLKYRLQHKAIRHQWQVKRQLQGARNAFLPVHR